jgi:DNA-directed RNA polymerase subunit M/transcription elongation factor TFIIS
MGIASPSRSTVPVACPSCRHEGPAFVDLLGKRSRCKKCGHNFTMPRNVRMGCPHCLAELRVPAEAIGRDVACKFCGASFRAEPARAERRRLERNAPEPSQRVTSLERDLSRVSGEHEGLRAELARLRAEHEHRGRRDHREIEELRAQLDRLAAVQAAASREVDRPVPLVPPAARPGTPPSSMVRHVPQANGHARPTPASFGRGRRGGAGLQARPDPGGAALREVIDRLASCEAMTDRLLVRLKSAQEQRELDREAYAKVLERLQEELTRARGDFRTGCGDSDDPAGRDERADGNPDAMATTPCLSNFGAA